MATVTMGPDPEKFFLGIQPKSEDRRVIEVSEEDAKLIKSLNKDLDKSVQVTDMVTGEKIVVAPASCGLPNCNCALEIFECDICKEIGNGFGPRHNGSKHCESGSIASGGYHVHCSCDTCF